MRGRKSKWVVSLSAWDRFELERWQRSTTLPAGLARRARIVLLLDEGQTFAEAARAVGMTVRNTRQWVKRYLVRGLDGLHDKPGRGRKPVFSPRGGDTLGEDCL